MAENDSSSSSDGDESVCSDPYDNPWSSGIAAEDDYHHNEPKDPRSTIPTSRSTIFAQWTGGVFASVPASGMFGVDRNRSGISNADGTGVCSNVSLGTENSVKQEPTKAVRTDSMAERVENNGAAKGTSSTPACLDIIARVGHSLPAAAHKTVNVGLAAIPIAMLSYATMTTYALLIVEGTTLPRELMVSIQLLSSVVSGVLLALFSECPLSIAAADVSIALFYQVCVSQV